MLCNFENLTKTYFFSLHASSSNPSSSFNQNTTPRCINTAWIQLQVKKEGQFFKYISVRIINLHGTGIQTYFDSLVLTWANDHHGCYFGGPQHWGSSRLGHRKFQGLSHFTPSVWKAGMRSFVKCMKTSEGNNGTYYRHPFWLSSSEMLFMWANVAFSMSK